MTELPQNVDDILNLDDLEVWLFDPARSIYKFYSSDSDIIRILASAPKRLGIRPGATYSKGGRVFARDFLVRVSAVAEVLELVAAASNHEENRLKPCHFR